jgi:purine-cytosine permease-like protein
MVGFLEIIFLILFFCNYSAALKNIYSKNLSLRSSAKQSQSYENKLIVIFTFIAGMGAGDCFVADTPRNDKECEQTILNHSPIRAN